MYYGGNIDPNPKVRANSLQLDLGVLCHLHTSSCLRKHMEIILDNGSLGVHIHDEKKLRLKLKLNL